MARIYIPDNLIHDSENISHDLEIFDNLCKMATEIAVPVIGEALAKETSKTGAKALIEEAQTALKLIMEDFPKEDSTLLIENLSKYLGDQLPPPDKQYIREQTKKIVKSLIGTWIEVLSHSLEDISVLELTENLIPTLNQMDREVGRNLKDYFSRLPITYDDALLILGKLGREISKYKNSIPIPQNIVIIKNGVSDEKSTFSAFRETHIHQDEEEMLDFWHKDKIGQVENVKNSCKLFDKVMSGTASKVKTLRWIAHAYRDCKYCLRRFSHNPKDLLMVFESGNKVPSEIIKPNKIEEMLIEQLMTVQKIVNKSADEVSSLSINPLDEFYSLSKSALDRNVTRHFRELAICDIDVDNLNLKILDLGENWTLYEGNNPMFMKPERYLFFSSNARMGDVKSAEKILDNDQIATVALFPQSCKLNQEKTAKILGIKKGWSLPELQRMKLRKRLKQIKYDELIIEPDIVSGGPEAESDVAPEPGSKVLLKWLLADPRSKNWKPGVCVLYAPAAVGKSTFSEFLAAQIDEKDRVAMYLTPEQWGSLYDLDLIGALRIARDNRWVTTSLDDNDIVTAIKNGGLTLILDGFDELCTRHKPGRTANQALGHILELSHDSIGGARIMLTSRDQFWFGSVTSDLRNQCNQWKLLPFTEKQRERYLHVRHPENKNKATRKRCLKILREIDSHCYQGEQGATVYSWGKIPWVVATVANVNEPDSFNNSQPEGEHYVKLKENPLEILSFWLCKREMTKRHLNLSAEQQMQLFQELTCECGNEFTIKDVELFFTAVAGREATSEESISLAKHALMSSPEENGKYHLVYSPLIDMFSARCLVQDFGNKSQASTHAVVNSLKKCNYGTGMVLDLSVDELRSFDSIVKLEHLRKIHKDIWDIRESDAKSGFFHLATRILPDKSTNRNIALSELSTVFGAPINWLYVTGHVTNVVFSKCPIIASVFENVSFIQCDLSDAMFENCTFKGSIIFEESPIPFRHNFINCNFDNEAHRSLSRYLEKDVGGYHLTNEDVEHLIRIIFERIYSREDVYSSSDWIHKVTTVDYEETPVLKYVEGVLRDRKLLKRSKELKRTYEINLSGGVIKQFLNKETVTPGRIRGVIQEVIRRSATMQTTH